MHISVKVSGIKNILQRPQVEANSDCHILQSYSSRNIFIKHSSLSYATISNFHLE